MSSDVDGIKNLDEDDQATKHCSFILMFCGLVIFIKNFDPINTRRLCAPGITMLCSKVLMVNLLILSKAGALGCPFQFHIFFNKAFLVFGYSFLRYIIAMTLGTSFYKCTSAIMQVQQLSFCTVRC